MRLLLGGIVFLVVLQPLALYPPSVAGYAAKAIVVYLLARAFQWALVIYLFDRPEKRPAHVLYLVTLGIGSDFLSDLALPLFVDWFHKAMSHSSFIV